MASQTIDRFLKFDPFCNTIIDCCNTTRYTDYLSAAQNDVFLLPLSLSTPYDLYDCNDNLIQARFGVPASILNSSFSFRVSGYCVAAAETDCETDPCIEDCNCDDVSKFRFCTLFRDEDGCTPVCNCSNVITYTDETTFLDSIVTELSAFFDVVTRSQNVITVEWYQALSPSDDARCRSILTTNTNFSSSENECENWIEATCTLSPSTLTTKTNRCTEYSFLELMQIQGANLCVEIVEDKVCIDSTPMVSFDFSAIPCGNYYIKSDFGCSQTINVCDVCDTIFLKYRNYNEQLKQIRLKASITNLEFVKKQEISMSSDNTIRKLYAEMQFVWSLDVGEYRAGVHKDIAAALESDIVIFTDYFEDSFILQEKSFVHEDNYSINWETNFPRPKISTASTKIKESTTENLNNFV